MRIETIAIGDELLTGKTSDTNSTFVGDALFREGFELAQTTVIPDNVSVIKDTLSEVAHRAQFAVVFGGLGPTSDDKTAEVVRSVLGGGLVEHPESLEKLKTYYSRRGRALNAPSLKQVLYPERAEPLPNSVGMAPGFQCRIEDCEFAFLPGVPEEMKAMFVQFVMPCLRSRLGKDNSSLLSHSWRCLGVWESELQRIMNPIEAKLPGNAWLGYRTRYPENHLTLYVKGATAVQKSILENIKQQIGPLISEWTYSQKDEELEQIVVQQLKAQGKRLAFVESATGGLTTQRITRVAGASEVLWGGLVTYAFEAKKVLLGLELARPEDAVSASCSKALAEAVKRVSRCAIAAAVTGYAEPSLGTPESPEGTFYLCVMGTRILERKIHLPGRPRLDQQWAASCYLLDLIRQTL